MGTRLYVGNLPYAVTELDLRDLFGGVGTVTDAKIVTDRETGRPRGFGFVEMSTEEEARKAIEEINGRDVQGRQVAVKEAEDRRGGGGGGGGGWRRWRRLRRWRRWLRRRRCGGRRWRRWPRWRGGGGGRGRW
jgi:RNA recognition motif-containing protein